MNTKLVSGVGINDLSENVIVNGVALQFYNTWNHMIQRCYSEKCQLKQPSYIGCSVCDEWKHLSNFKKWYDENYKEGFHLDKDILIEGNKVYSPATCRYVPRYLNNLLNDNSASRDELPKGLSEQKPIYGRRVTSSYQARCNNGYGKQTYKTFKTIPEAQEWYSATKQRIVKEQATRAFLANEIKTDVYLALVRRKF